VEVLWRGAFGMDAKRGMSGQGWPVLPTLGAVPERVESGAARSGCRARFLFGNFLREQRDTQRSCVTAAGWPEG
jgi:hypothetical protein